MPAREVSHGLRRRVTFYRTSSAGTTNRYQQVVPALCTGTKLTPKPSKLKKKLNAFKKDYPQQTRLHSSSYLKTWKFQQAVETKKPSSVKLVVGAWSAAKFLPRAGTSPQPHPSCAADACTRLHPGVLPTLRRGPHHPPPLVRVLSSLSCAHCCCSCGTLVSRAFPAWTRTWAGGGLLARTGASPCWICMWYL